MAVSEMRVTQQGVRHAMNEREGLSLLEQIAQRGDHAAFAELFSRYEKRAYSLALHLTRNHDLAQDAVQEAMLDVWLHASAYRPGNEAGWILRIVANRSLALAQRNKMKGIRMLEQEATDVADRSPSPAEYTEREEQLSMLRDNLKRLPVLDQQVLALCYAGGLTQAEVGDALALSQATVSSRIGKAFALIRSQLAQAGYAAALPLVSAAGLSEALCSGYEVPPGLREKVLERVAQAAGKSLRTAATHSRRVAAAKAGGAAGLLAGLAVAVAAGGALWWAAGSKSRISSAPAEISPVPLEATSSPAVSSAPKLEPFFRRWTFEKGPPTDIEVRDGTWTWDGNESMVVQEMAMLLLPPPPPRRPFMVQTQHRIFLLGNASNGSAWSDGDQVLPTRRWALNYQKVVQGEKCMYREYFMGPYLFGYSGDELVVIFEYTVPVPASCICIGQYNHTVEEILVRTLEENEIPADLKNPKALIEKLRWPMVEIGAQPFPPRAKP